ncbi:hypothetical protein PED39_04180 [Methanomassiliicoccales archaeon LGM-RCC1]|nr:hypothetical protein PED39_04180 [Methanomassiliicoccales archaeon LGM-RCC1]
MGKIGASAENYVESFLVLLLVVSVLVEIIRGMGSEVGGVEGSLINVIADVISPEVTLILLALGAFLFFTSKMIRSRE